MTTILKRIDIGPARVIPKGVYDATTSYEYMNMVSYDGELWQLISNDYVIGDLPIEGDTPGISTSGRWARIGGGRGRDGIDGAQGPQGIQGVQGPQGPQGPQGAIGTAPVLEYASGGRETVMYDDLGLPSVMVRIPAVTYKDVLRKFYADETAWNASVFKAVEGELLPAFKHNGSPIKALWIAKYMASIQQDRAVSLPGVNPSVSVTYDQARDYCQSKGSGWHLTTGYEWMAVTLVEMAMGTQPRGNTNWGQHHTNVWESGVRLDGGLPGVTTGDGKTLTGSGGKVWETQSGIADMVGNCWDWTHLLKLVDGKVYAPSDNYYDLAESSWPDTGVRIDSTGGTADGTGVTSGGAPVISNAVTKYTGVPGQTATDYSSSGTTFTAITKKTGYTVPAIAYMLGLCPLTLDGATYETNNPPAGNSYQRNYGERLPFRGGRWCYGASAGLFYLHLGDPRSLSDGGVGFRPAFVEL